MDPARAFAGAVVAVIVAVTLASGPLVGAVDFTREEEESFAPGSGTADVTVVSVPETARLDKGEYGSGSYYLRVPDATIDVATVTGNPMVVYKLKLPALGYTRGTTTFLSSGDTGRQPLGMEDDALAPDRVGRESYEGELRVLVRDDAGERTLYRGNVTVTVRD